MKHWSNGKRTISISGSVSHIARAQKVHGIQSSIKNISGKIITALYLALLCILFAQMASAQIPLASVSSNI